MTLPDLRTCTICRAPGFTPAGLKRHVTRVHARIPPHGTLTRYQYHGCRCDKCKAKNTLTRRESRARDRAQALKMARILQERGGT